jgi:hypothetical protein
VTRFQPILVEELWTIRCSDGRAHASIWTHRFGWELRLLWDGVPAWSRCDPDLRQVRRDAHEMKIRISRDGRGGLDGF